MKGYDKLAALAGCHPRMLMVRSFSTLGAKTLFYLQAELAHLEKDLESIARKDSESNSRERQLFQNSWWDLQRARPGEDRQWKRVQEIRIKLNEYCEFELKICLLMSIFWGVSTFRYY